ncbi:MAG: 3-hydroxyanthranilate 3,4-dioxygenase [Gammaproteobacteria bacterium]|nr:3-hydroxyanthranilate 3,4-dioxygenase [Gammaproteobacteria bacterium]
MKSLTAFNFREWIDAHRQELKPPVCNRQVFDENDFIVMVVGGPNSRTDYHYDEGPEFFYQLEGDMLLKTMQEGKRVDIPIREGEILLLPPKVPHSPQRFENTVGLVVERKRLPGELDGFMWYCDKCNNLLYEEYLYIDDIVGQLPPIFDRFYDSVENRTCSRCGTVMADRT